MSKDKYTSIFSGKIEAITFLILQISKNHGGRSWRPFKLAKIMAVGRCFKLSANLCVFLCIYIPFDSYRFSYLRESTLLNDREIYFASQMNCRTRVGDASFLLETNDPKAKV